MYYPVVFCFVVNHAMPLYRLLLSLLKRTRFKKQEQQYIPIIAGQLQIDSLGTVLNKAVRKSNV